MRLFAFQWRRYVGVALIIAAGWLGATGLDERRWHEMTGFIVSEFVPPIITVSSLSERLTQGDRIAIIDVRPPELFLQEHIRGAVNYHWALLDQDQAKLPKETLLVLYCTCPDDHASAVAARDLHDRFGFHNVAILAGGMGAWKQEGHATNSPWSQGLH